MNREQARDFINSLVDSHLIKAEKEVNGYYSYICPLCSNGSGSDGDGICTKDGKYYKCFKCDFYGDYLEYLKKLHNETETEVFKRYNVAISKDTVKKQAKTKQPSESENSQAMVNLPQPGADSRQADKVSAAISVEFPFLPP